MKLNKITGIIAIGLSALTLTGCVASHAFEVYADPIKVVAFERSQSGYQYGNGDHWKYGEIKDEFTGVITHYAETKANKTVQLQGLKPAEVTLLVVRTNQSGKDVSGLYDPDTISNFVFRTSSGSFACNSTEGCRVRVRLDGQLLDDALLVPDTAPTSKYKQGVSIEYNRSGFYLTEVFRKDYKTLEVELPFFENGYHILKFDLSGLDLRKLLDNGELERFKKYRGVK